LPKSKRRGKASKTKATTHHNIKVQLINWMELGLLDEPAPFPLYLEDVKRLSRAKTLTILIVKNGIKKEISAKTEKDWKDQFTKG
jgi:hypothetical protein